MKTYLIVILMTQMLLTGNVLFACTVFYASDSDMALGGNNEDGQNPDTKIR